MDHKARVSLRDWYRDGVGVERNFEAAVDSYKHEADRHLVPECLRIADCFFRVYWHEALSEMDHHRYNSTTDKIDAQALMQLAFYNVRGFGVAENRLLAFK